MYSPFKHFVPSIDLTIVIVNFNTRSLVLNCIEGIGRFCEDLDYEIIVVDNDSEDGSVEAIKERFPNVFVIANDDNRGLSAANNQGIQESRGRYIVLLNSDTELYENSFFKLIQWMDAHSDYAVISPKILDQEDKVSSMRLRQDTPRDALQKTLGWFNVDKEFLEMGTLETKEVEVVGGSCLFIRRSLFEQIGLLDENYFLYNEEDDLCRRARNVGSRICFFADTGVRHLVGQSTHQSRIREKVILETYKSNLYFFFKHYSFFWNMLLRGLYKGVILASLALNAFRMVFGCKPDTADHSLKLKLKLLFL